MLAGEEAVVGSNRRYADHYDLLMDARLLDQIAATAGPLQSLTDAELELDREPVTIAPRPQAVQAWVRFGPTAVRVEAEACRWTERAVGVLAALLAFAELWREVVTAQGLALLDRPVLEAFRAARMPSLDHAMTLYTHVGGPGLLWFWLVPLAAGLAWRARSWTPIVLTAVAYGGAEVLTRATKAFFGRQRPAFEFAVPPFNESPAFPSGHALHGAVVACLVAALLLDQVRTPAARTVVIVVTAVFGLTIGVSRLYVGHHWLTDVLSGWLLGLAWWGAIRASRRLLGADSGRVGAPATR